MKYSFLLPILCFQILQGCQNERKVKDLETENQWLRGEMEVIKDELRACREGQPIFPESDNVLHTLDENNQNDKLDLDLQINMLLNDLGKDEKRIARKVENQSVAGIDFIERLRKKLVKELCGKGCVELQSEHYKDVATINRVMLDEGEGKKLKMHLENLLQGFSNYNIEPENLELFKTLHPQLMDERSLEEFNKSWENYKFKDMPPSVLLPILSYMQISIRKDELAVLKSLEE